MCMLASMGDSLPEHWAGLVPLLTSWFYFICFQFALKFVFMMHSAVFSQTVSLCLQPEAPFACVHEATPRSTLWC